MRCCPDCARLVPALWSERWIGFESEARPLSSRNAGSLSNRSQWRLWMENRTDASESVEVLSPVSSALESLIHITKSSQYSVKSA